jgi:glucans biosynthesis protein C
MAESVLHINNDVTAPTATAKSSRMVFVDYLRAVLLIFVVLHHVAMVYGASAPYYYVEPPFTDPQGFKALLIFALTNQAWHMGAFFLLAGYFTPRSFDHKGKVAFLKDRLTRLGIPLIVYFFILNPLAVLGVYLMPSELTGITGSPSLKDYPGWIGLGPLWFVAMLLIFSFIYVGWRMLIGSKSIDENNSPIRITYLGVGVFVLVLAIFSFLFRMMVPLGESVKLFVDALSFPSIAYLPQYVSFFMLGIIAYRNDWLRTIPSAMGIISFVVAGIATIVLFPLAFSGQFLSFEVTPELENAMGNGHWQSAVYVAWDSIFSVCMFLGSITFFRQCLNRKSWLGTFLSQQSYAVYVIHIPIVVYLAYLLRNTQLDAVPKTIMASIIIVPTCFLVAYFVRKLPYISRVL